MVVFVPQGVEVCAELDEQLQQIGVSEGGMMDCPARHPVLGIAPACPPAPGTVRLRPAPDVGIRKRRVFVQQRAHACEIKGADRPEELVVLVERRPLLRPRWLRRRPLLHDACHPASL